MSFLPTTERVSPTGTLDISVLFWPESPGNAADFFSEETFCTFLEHSYCCFNNKERLDIITVTYEKLLKHRRMVKYYIDKNIGASYVRVYKEEKNSKSMLRFMALLNS